MSLSGVGGIFDLRKPPSGHLLSLNIYDMLSRVSNWEDLAILRPFEDSMLQFLQLDEELIEETPSATIAYYWIYSGLQSDVSHISFNDFVFP